MSESRSGRHRAALAAGIGFVAVAVHVRALDVGFFSDDYEWLGRMAPTLENPFYVFRVFYRDFNPVLHLSFLFDFLAGGGSPVVFHGTSLLVHGLCAALLVLLGFRFTDRSWIVALAAATWALNPRLSEAVIWPAARGHSLATLFVLAALLALGRRAGWRRWLSLPLFGLALLTKEVALFPLLLTPLFVREPRRSRGLLVAHYGLALAFLAFNYLFKPELHLSPASPWFLLRKIPFVLLRPLGLGDHYDFGLTAFLVAGLALCAAAFLLWRSGARVGVLWVAVCLVPLVPLDKLSSRYLYLLAIGYAIALCSALGPLVARLQLPLARRAAAIGGALLVALVLLANVLRVQREIEDYAILAKPYADCLATLEGVVRTVGAGETLVVLDVGPRDEPQRLQRLLRERGTMNKLIPLRPAAVGGLIELVDAVNLIRAEDRELLARSEALGDSANGRYVVYDGETARFAAGLPPGPAAREDGRLLAVRLVPAPQFFK